MLFIDSTTWLFFFFVNDNLVNRFISPIIVIFSSFSMTKCDIISFYSPSDVLSLETLLLDQSEKKTYDNQLKYQNECKFIWFQNLNLFASQLISNVASTRKIRSVNQWRMVLMILFISPQNFCSKTSGFFSLQSN